MIKPKLLQVYANPFACELDHNGRPHAHVQYEPNPRVKTDGLQYVGCRLIATKLGEIETWQGVQELHDHEWEYATEPSVVPATSYYLQLVRQHALLSANAETHAVVFGSKAGFRCAKERMAQYVAEHAAAGRVAIPRLFDEGEPKEGATLEEHRAARWHAFASPAAMSKPAPDADHSVA